MQTKFTLSIDENVIKEAKKVAKKNKMSLSRMVADYFLALVKVSNKSVSYSPILREISGVLSSRKSQKKYLDQYKNHLKVCKYGLEILLKVLFFLP